MIARGDLAIDIGHSEVPKVQLSLIKKCSQFSKSVIVATQMLESMIENNTATRAEINDIAATFPRCRYSMLQKLQLVSFQPKLFQLCLKLFFQQKNIKENILKISKIQLFLIKIL